MPDQEIKYGVVAFLSEKPDDIVHFCGYDYPPSMGDISSLREELINEGSLKETALRLQFRFASSIEVEYFKWLTNN